MSLYELIAIASFYFLNSVLDLKIMCSLQPQFQPKSKLEENKRGMKLNEILGIIYKNRPNLLEALTKHNEIEKIVENKGNLIVVGCQ